MRKNILKLGYFLLALFVLLVGYLSYLQLYRGPALAANPYNRRFYELEKNTLRGSIYDSRGVVLAQTDFSTGTGRRVYPRGAETAGVIGYISDQYGRTGIESLYDRNLLGLEGADQLRNLLNRTLDRRQAGGDITLTLDAGLQGKAVDLLNGRRGAAVVMDVRSGALLVLATSPSFDPNRLDAAWENLTRDKSSPLLNRATDGAYPPGSTFKLVTAAGALAARPETAGQKFNCPGYLVADGFKLTDQAAHGEVDIRKAIAVSCNTTFGRLGLEIGPQGFTNAVRSFGLDQAPPLEMTARAGSFAPLDRLTDAEIASSAIGQGEILVSPLQMAMVATAIANKGVIMKPYLVEEIRDSAGFTLKKGAPAPWRTAASPEAAKLIGQGMIDSVLYGTATGAQVPGLAVAGKTGSAENPGGITHAWFVGYAPADAPRYVVAVIVENAGHGGAVAAPVGAKLLNAAYKLSNQ